MHVKSLITAGLAVAATAAPAAQAENPLGHPGGPVSVGIVSAQSSYLGHPGGPTSVGIVQIKTAASTSFRGLAGGPGSVGLVRGKPSSSNSYLGHVGGPGGVGLVVLAPTPVTQPRGGFDWGDAGVGAGFMTGIGLLVAAAGLMLRRRRPLTQLQS